MAQKQTWSYFCVTAGPWNFMPALTEWFLPWVPGLLWYQVSVITSVFHKRITRGKKRSIRFSKVNKDSDQGAQVAQGWILCWLSKGHELLHLECNSSSSSSQTHSVTEKTTEVQRNSIHTFPTDTYFTQQIFPFHSPNSKGQEKTLLDFTFLGETCIGKIFKNYWFKKM